MFQELKKQLKKIRAYIVRKVELKGFIYDARQLTYELELTNFRKSKKMIQPFLIVDDDMQYELNYSLIGNKLEIHVPFHLIGQVVKKAHILLKINNEKMWIKEAQEYDESQAYFIYDHRYLKVSVSKNIKLSHRHRLYSFSRDGFILNNLDASYNTLYCMIEEGITPAFLLIDHKQNKLRELHIKTTERGLALTGFEYVPQGFWQLYACTDKELRPVQSKKEMLFEFHSLNHCIAINEKDGFLFMQFQPHELIVQSMEFEKQRDMIMLAFRTQIPLEPASVLIMNDLALSENKEYPLSMISESTYSTAIPLEELYRGFSKKRFFILTTAIESVKSQLNLDQTKLAADRWRYPEVIDSQSVSVSFYRRKDASLGVQLPRPKLRKQIRDIKGSRIKGELGSLGRFIDCRVFLLIEERETGLAKELEIERQFSIDLQTINLCDLKSKGKTVLDFYIVLKNSVDEIIRKEKIKYEHADYRKDNFYGHWTEQDLDGNLHHFLLTTTPFDNLKIETFVIAKDLVLPNDPSVKDANVWLIGERYDTAQDNGLALFEWLTANTDIEAYYVIEENALDYQKIKHYQNVLRFGSPEHFNVAFKAKVLLGTHDLENLLPYKPAKGFFGYENTVKVFLQHGVLGRKNVEYHKHNYDLPFDLFVVSSDPEKYDVVIDKFGYNEDEVIVTGLARFDKLPKENDTRDILLMPTWRDWIHNDEQFLNSAYYHAYANLINNAELLALLEDYDVRLNFYPHYRAQVYFNEEIVSNPNRVRFIPLGIRHVQELLIEHALLITDYSTVSFDFTMMNKPVVFYHFDVKQFFKRGILRPVEETFLGKIASTEEELVSLIKDRLEAGFSNYQMDISGVIKYQDYNNSKRIYEHVIQFLNQ
ncbi:CDP-glycerol glycerophosphotransferase family protein [Aciduricibacillus chroicocephali]|uniref:CDP-glycerol glycerophosphotransferase family protein n=1 Tax=Aciduricibacillus chroicocephali TaxID=3054939 RepID=A0ABY9KW97_9BACI|nr:CDP-glycerol glycerophosphotransferase family protein [Bacillaceae bacterium 44XB]